VGNKRKECDYGVYLNSLGGSLTGLEALLGAKKKLALSMKIIVGLKNKKVY